VLNAISAYAKARAAGAGAIRPANVSIERVPKAFALATILFFKLTVVV